MKILRPEVVKHHIERDTDVDSWLLGDVAVTRRALFICQPTWSDPMTPLI